MAAHSLCTACAGTSGSAGKKRLLVGMEQVPQAELMGLNSSRAARGAGVGVRDHPHSNSPCQEALGLIQRLWEQLCPPPAGNETTREICCHSGQCDPSTDPPCGPCREGHEFSLFLPTFVPRAAPQASPGEPGLLQPRITAVNKTCSGSRGCRALALVIISYPAPRRV